MMSQTIKEVNNHKLNKLISKVNNTCKIIITMITIILTINLLNIKILKKIKVIKI